MLLFLLASVILAGPNPPSPPYRRIASVATGQQSFRAECVIDNNRIYVSANDSLKAYNLTNLKPIWTALLGKRQYAEHVATDGKNVYVSTQAYRNDPCYLYAVNPASGKVLWKLRRRGASSAIAVDRNRLYTSLASGQVSAVDVRKHSIAWTTKLPGLRNDPFESTASVMLVSGSTLLVHTGNQLYALSSASGKRLWNMKECYALSGQLAVVDKTVWLALNDGSVAKDVRTGRELWRSKEVSYAEFAGVFDGSFVGLSNGFIGALNPKTGGLRWTHKVGENVGMGGQHGAVLGHHLFVHSTDKSFMIGAGGKILWSKPEDESIWGPIWTDGRRLVCFEGARLLLYESGSTASAPTDHESRQALASRLIARLSELDRSEFKRLTDLGDDAFEPLLQEFLKASHAHDELSKNKPNADSYPLYRKAHDLGDLLPKVTKPNRADDLMKAIDTEKPDSSAKPLLLTLLADVGDPKVVTPYFLRELEGFKTPDFEMYESNSFVSREYIANSSDPRAVAFMLKLLRDPNADPTMRFEAYVNLARTGGDEGLKEVLNQRHKRTLLKTVEERFAQWLANKEDGKAPTPIAEKKDNEGRVWGLFECWLLGSRGDLWLAEKVEGRWSRPYFTGVSTEGVSRWVEPTPPEPRFAGKTAKELAAGAWFAILVPSKELRLDSDGDGLTDIVEKRLGTNAKASDTDGDGDRDDIDPWPNVAKRPLTDEQKVLDAVFEARYHIHEGSGVALFNAESEVEPFEMAGRSSTTIWQREGKNTPSHPLFHCYEQGVAVIRFHGGGEHDGDKTVSWNKDRTEAEVVISTYYGGLNGTGYAARVRRFGSDWVVVKMKMAYIS